MLFFYGIWMLCHHGQSPKKGEKSKQRFLGYNEKTHFPFVKSARKPRNVSFLTQNPRFLRIVGYPADRQQVWYRMQEKGEQGQIHSQKEQVVTCVQAGALMWVDGRVTWKMVNSELHLPRRRHVTISTTDTEAMILQ